MRSRHGAALGAVATLGWWLFRFGFPGVNPFLWFIISILAFGGAVLGAGLILSVRHGAIDRLVIVRSGVLLALLSTPFIWSHLRSRQATPSFMAKADSVRARVDGHNVFGNLLLFFVHDSTPQRYVAARKIAHDSLAQGDSIWVYLSPDSNPTIDTWPPGPDSRIFVRRMVWFWLIGAIVLCAYGPLLYPRFIKNGP